MNLQIPPPFVCSMFGACAGLVFGNCQCFPVWVGAASGASIGCLMCIAMCIANPLPVAKIVEQKQNTIIVQHIHIYEIGSTGAAKESPKV